MNKIILSIAALNIFVLTGCGIVRNITGEFATGPAPATIDPARYLQVDDFTVIYGAEYTEEFIEVWWLYGAEVDGYWTPDLDQHVRPMQATLPAYLREQLGDFPDDERIEVILADYDRYYGQFFGVVIAGERVLMANYACDVYEGWQDQLMIVLDGGACFFSVWYMPDDDSFRSLSINGYA